MKARTYSRTRKIQGPVEARMAHHRGRAGDWAQGSICQGSKKFQIASSVRCGMITGETDVTVAMQRKYVDVGKEI